MLTRFHRSMLGDSRQAEDSRYGEEAATKYFGQLQEKNRVVNHGVCSRKKPPL